MITSLQELTQWIEKQAPPGPPPRPGLQWKPTTHRWIRPEELEVSDRKALSFSNRLQEILETTMDFGEGHKELLDKYVNTNRKGLLEELGNMWDGDPELQEDLHSILREEIGDTIKIYRGMRRGEEEWAGDYINVTTDYATAERFGGTDIREVDIPVEQVVGFGSIDENELIVDSKAIEGEEELPSEETDTLTLKAPSAFQGIDTSEMPTKKNADRNEFAESWGFFRDFYQDVQHASLSLLTNEYEVEDEGNTEWAGWAMSKMLQLPYPIYRGIALSDEGLEKYKEGGDITIALSSFSKDRKMARGYGIKAAEDQMHNPVILELAESSLGMRLPPDWRDEDEVLSAGSFKVTKIKKSGKTTVISLEPNSGLNAMEYSMAKTLLLKQAPPGPPPRPGLQWKPQTHRWIRPKTDLLQGLRRLTDDKFRRNMDFLRWNNEYFSDARRTPGSPTKERFDEIVSWLVIGGKSGRGSTYTPDRIKMAKDSPYPEAGYVPSDYTIPICEALVGERFPNNDNVNIPKRHARKIIDITLSTKIELVDRDVKSMEGELSIAGRMRKPPARYQAGSTRSYIGAKVTGGKMELFNVKDVIAQAPLNFAQTVVHEMSHGVYFDLPRWSQIRIENLWIKAVKANKGLPSQYAKEDEYEFFAECYTAYVTNTQAFRKRHPTMADELDIIFSKGLRERSEKWGYRQMAKFPPDSDERIGAVYGLTGEEYRTAKWNNANQPTEEEISRKIGDKALVELMLRKTVVDEEPLVIEDPEGVIGFTEDLPNADPIEMPEIPEESFEEDEEDLELQAPPGPPPREGLQWKPQTHRWIRPKDEDSDEFFDFPTDVESDNPNEFEYLAMEYNDLIDNPDLASNVANGVKELRLENLGERDAMQGYFHLNDWVDGQVMKVVGIRSVLSEMREESLDKEAIRTQLSGVFQSQGETREVTDGPIDLALEIGRMSLMTSVKDAEGKMSDLSIEPFKELMKNEQKFAEKRTRELFGDSITVHRAIYGPAASAIQEQLKFSDYITIDSFPMSSYSMDLTSCYAFATQQGGGQSFIIFTREIPAEDVLSAWYSNNAFLDNMPHQKEVVVNPKNLRFMLSNEDIKYNVSEDYSWEEAEEEEVSANPYSGASAEERIMYDKLKAIREGAGNW